MQFANSDRFKENHSIDAVSIVPTSFANSHMGFDSNSNNGLYDAEQLASFRELKDLINSAWLGHL